MICFSMKILSMDKRLNFSLIFEQPTNYFTDIDRLNIFGYFFGKIKKKEKRMKIKVGDKVKWAHVFRSINRNCFGHVVSTDEKVMGNPCFLIKECGEKLETMVSKDKVSKV